MKRIIYSNYTKVIAVILFIVSVVLTALVFSTGIADFFREEERIYRFENDFSESRHLSDLLDETENVVFNAYNNFYYADDENESTPSNQPSAATEQNSELIVVWDAQSPLPLAANLQKIEQNIEQRLNDLYCADKINYYIKWNDRVFTNCGATSPEELMQGEFYSYVSRVSETGFERDAKPRSSLYSSYLLEHIARYDAASTITMCTGIKEEYIAECRAVWERQEAIVNNTFTKALFFAVFALLLLVYLICVCGKDKDGEQKTVWLDNVWLEVHLAAIGSVGFGALFVCTVVLYDYSAWQFPYNLTNMIVGVVSALASAVVLASLLSVIRNIKCRRFVESSVIFRIIRWCWRTFVKVVKACKEVLFRVLSKKSGIILISMLLAYTALIGFFGILAPEAPFFFILAILVFFFAAFVVAYRAKDLDEVKKGVSEICSGNSMYKIPELKSEDMKLLATNINEIGKSVDESVSAKLKAERLKTELITNVSHDLKTPLTSIISYTELLSKVENLPEEAKDYANIIAQKSERLKNLTHDLFDISKVQSGNENVVFERLDASLLINQSLAEHDSEIQKSGLKFCVDAPKELYISADGRKMSRVISNLINNILKYTMENTRVFITAAEKDNEVILEFKNISSYPMEFDAEEIMGRFVRGDESRTSEGNGLGLAIAKSYTEVCGGKFDIVLDGDMFKAIIKFGKY